MRTIRYVCWAIIATIVLTTSRWAVPAFGWQNGDVWTSDGALAGVLLEPLVLTATFNSIGIEVPFSEVGGQVQTVTGEFRTQGDLANVRATLPLWPTRPADPATQPGAAAFGSVLLADAGATYEIRVTVRDRDGNTQRLVGTVTTRTDDIPARTSLQATHFVNAATGDDGRSEAQAQNPATPWKTLRRANQAAPAGAVVQVAPGYYSEPGSAYPRTLPVTYLAEFPAVDDQQRLINPGQHAVIQDGEITGAGAATSQRPYTSGPGGSGAPFENVWEPDAALSAIAGRPIWRWQTASHQMSAVATQMGYHAQMADPPRRIGNWANNVDGAATGDTRTREGWAALLGSNATYRAGFYSDPDTSTPGARYSLYLAPPPNMRRADGAVTSDPNEVFITVGAGYGPIFRAPDVRFSGFEVRTLSDCVGVGNTDGNQAGNGRNVYDHNVFVGCLNGIRIISPPTAGLESNDHVIERNLFLDYNLWSTDQASEPSMPWSFIKEKITVSSGALWSSQRVGLYSESTGVNMTNMGSKRTVIRHNTFDGTMNGTSMSGAAPLVHRDSGRDLDFHDNVCQNIVDDCIEPEHAKVNIRIWNNVAHDVVVFWSAAPIHYGPVFVFRNRVWDVGSKGSAPELASGRRPIGSGTFMKGSGLNPSRKHVRSIFYIVHNSFWTDQDGSGQEGRGFTPVSGPDDTLNGAATFNPVKYLRNNIFRTTRYAFLIGQSDWSTGYDEDYNVWASTDARLGARFDGVAPYNSPQPDGVNSLGAYRAALAGARDRPPGFGNAEHSNRIGQNGADIAFVDFAAVDALYADPAHGDLRLRDGENPAVDAGTPVPNISDRPGIDYQGAAPDLGAVER